jgi:uncharacterized protein
MDITPLIPKDKLVIKSYSSCFFNISGVRRATDIIITGNIVTEWVDASLESILKRTVELDIRPEIVLVGYGRDNIKPNKQVANDFARYNIAIEFMDTGSACRTYNILLAEGREVCAFLKRFP